MLQILESALLWDFFKILSYHKWVSMWYRGKNVALGNNGFCPNLSIVSIQLDEFEQAFWRGPFLTLLFVEGECLYLPYKMFEN